VVVGCDGDRGWSAEMLIIHSGRWTFVSTLNNFGFMLIPSSYPDLNHIGSATVERFFALIAQVTAFYCLLCEFHRTSFHGLIPVANNNLQRRD
jgi:hypothetical protein